MKSYVKLIISNLDEFSNELSGKNEKQDTCVRNEYD